MKTKWLLMMLAAAALFALSASAGAAEVAIVNPGFESPVMDEGGWTYGGVDGWTEIGIDAMGVWNPGGTWPGYPVPDSDQVPEGQQVVWVDGGGLSQVLTETLTANTEYTLSVQVGNNYYYTSSDYVIELRAGETVLADFGENAEANITDDTFELRTVTYTYDPADAALLGETLEIRFTVAGAEVDFDDVKLDAVRCLFMDPSPADGATVDPASDLLLSWTNRDPNYEGHSLYVDVWFGTDPNHPSPNWTKVVDAGEETASVQVDASSDGTYYWQVNSYLYGSPTGDPCQGCVWRFNVLSDLPPTVDAGVDMMTWSGEPVPLDPTVVDDGVSDVTYAWSAAPADGVSWPDGADVKDAKVTIDKSGSLTTLVLNPGFEKQVLADGAFVNSAYGWPEGYYGLTSGTWNDWPGVCGAINPDAAYGYGGVAPEGQNIGDVEPDENYRMGLSQTLPVALQANTQHDLSVKVGTPDVTSSGGYAIELLAGDVVIKKFENTAPASNTWESVSLTHNTGSAGSDPNVGQPITIRLLTTGGSLVNFDDVQLTPTPGYPFSAVHTVTLTLAVNDEVGSDTDSMTIDVYDDACDAARIGLSRAAENPGDIDKNCITDLKDLAAMLLTWLDTAPPEWP